MSEHFEGRTAIVTGASSGIGRRTAELLARRGARVAIFSRSGDKLWDVARSFGESMIPVSGDAADESAVERLFAETERRLGSCDLLVNAAGMVDPASVVRTTPEQWDRMFAVNIRSAFLTCRRALPGMISRKAGAIVNVASISGVPGPVKFPGFASYCASKAAVIGFTEALAVEVKEHGIRVNAVSPGSVDTPMWATTSGGAPADMAPDEVAEMILFLLSDQSRPVNGQNVHVFSA